MTDDKKEEGFQEIKGTSLGELTISEILSEMIKKGADTSELKMILPNGLGLLMRISIEDVFHENEE